MQSVRVPQRDGLEPESAGQASRSIGVVQSRKEVVLCSPTVANIEVVPSDRPWVARRKS